MGPSYVFLRAEGQKRGSEAGATIVARRTGSRQGQVSEAIDGRKRLEPGRSYHEEDDRVSVDD